MYEKLFQEYAELKSSRGTWEDQWQQIADYGLGSRNFVGQTSPGRQRQTLIFDGTFAECCDELAAALLVLGMNPYSRWMWVEDPDPNVMAQPGAAQHFELETEQLYRIMADPRSAFYTSAHESFWEYAGYGSMGFFAGAHETERRIQYQALPLQDCFVAEDGYGFVSTLYLRKVMKAHEAVSLWRDNVSERVKKELEAGRPLTEFEFVQAIMPNHLAKKRGFQMRAQPYLSCILECEAKHVVKVEGFWEKPFMFSRFAKDTREVYGRGPGYNALTDAKMLNRMARTFLVAAEKASDPPLMVMDEGILGRPTTQPNGIMVVRQQANGQFPAQYLVNPARMDMPQERFEAVRNQVKSRFFADVLQGMQDPRANVPQTLELQARLVRRLGPTTFRIQSEFAEPVVARTYALAQRMGLMPPRPEFLRGRPVKIVYISPSARAQMSADVQAILSTVGAAMEWSQADQDVIDNVDFDIALKQLAYSYGNVGKILRKPVDIETIRRAKDEAAAQQRQLMQAQQMTQIAGQATAPMGQAA